MTTETPPELDDETRQLLTEVKAFLEEREAESALMLLEDHAEQTTGPEAELLRTEAQILLAEDLEDALETLQRAADAGADPEKVADLFRRIRVANVSPRRQAEILTWLSERLDDTEIAISLAKIMMRRKRPTLSEEAANRALDIDPGLPEAHRALYVAILSSNTPERAVDAIREALTVSRKNPRYPALLSTLAGMEPKEAEALKSDMLDHWPHSLGRQVRTGDLNIQTDEEFKPEADGIYRQALDGDLDGALSRARDYIAQKQGINLSAKDLVIEDVLRRLPSPTLIKRPLVVDTNAEIIRSAPSLNGKTLLCFSDLTHRLNYDFEIIDAFAAKTGMATMFVRDHSFQLFIGGIGSLAQDRAGTITALRNELADLKTSELLVMGLSSGGFSAMSYARELGAERVLGVSIATSIGRFLRGDDRRARMLISRLSRTFSPEELDLMEVLPHIENEAPIDLYYGAGNATDTGHSTDIGDLPNVTLHPIEGHTRHQVLPKLISNGVFEAFLDG